jgi:hypothetical protein
MSPLILDVLTTLLFAVGAILLLAAVAVAIWYVPGYRRFQQEAIVTCPETSLPATVRVNALSFAATARAERPALGLASCTRWPQRAGCGRECLPQVEREAVRRRGPA